MGGEGLLRREALVGELTEPLRGQAEEPLGVADHERDVGVLGEDECVGARGESASLDPQDGSVAVEDLVGLVPVLLGPVAEEVDTVEIDRARHRAELVIDVLGIRHGHDLPERRVPLTRSTSGLSDPAPVES